ncbi:MAG: hypothetical protein ABMA13_19640, partial [Chthoniobacteraceae bacterium]
MSLTVISKHLSPLRSILPRALVLVAMLTMVFGWSGEAVAAAAAHGEHAAAEHHGLPAAACLS